MRIAGTGHRPPKLFLKDPYSPLNFLNLVGYTEGRLRELSDRYQKVQIISGMALGWDQALAQAATNLHIPWAAYIPFEGQEQKWPETSQHQFQQLLKSASDIRVINSGGYTTWKMQARNEAMVHSASLILALWDGSKGGTGNCIQFAEKQGKPTLNLWEDWVKERSYCL